MHCNICDRQLSEAEIIWNKELGKQVGYGAFEPCSTCLTASMEAAYTDGFHKPDEEADEVPHYVDYDSDPQHSFSFSDPHYNQYEADNDD